MKSMRAWSVLGPGLGLLLVCASPAAVLGGQRDPCIHDGDVNADGVISSGDAQTAFLIALGVVTPTTDQACAADCNGDGVVSSGDAQAIFLAALGSGRCPYNLPLGADCLSPLDCASGQCVDGVCCDTACTATCQRCNRPAALGTCGPIDLGLDPDSECGGVSCSGYYWGWDGADCLTAANVPAAAVFCNGAGACQGRADVCPSASAGAVSLTCDTACTTPDDETCGGTVPGSCTAFPTVEVISPKNEAHATTAYELSEGLLQSFKTTDAGTLSGVALHYQGLACSGSVLLRDGDGSGGTVLAVATVSWPLTSSRTWRTAAFVPQPAVAAGRALTVDALGLTCTGSLGASGYDDYAHGCLYRGGGGCDPSADLFFRVGFQTRPACGSCQQCNAAGSCAPVAAAHDPFNDCALCTFCDGAGACATVPSGNDPLDECRSFGCPGYYWGWDGATCYGRGNVTGAAARCDGAGACMTAPTLCPGADQGAAVSSCDPASCDAPDTDTCTGTLAGSCELAMSEVQWPANRPPGDGSLYLSTIEWQSMTMELDGELTSILVYYTGLGVSGTVYLRNGEGDGGPILASVAVNWAASGSLTAESIDFDPPVAVSAGQLVTLDLTGLSGSMAALECTLLGDYAGGTIGSYFGGDMDIVFETAVRIPGDCGTCDRCSPSGVCEPVATGTDPFEHCGTCQTCNGSGACAYWAAGNDPLEDCGGIDCSDYYWGWQAGACHYRDDVHATDTTCDGAGHCPTAAALCPGQGQSIFTALRCDSTCATPDPATCLNQTDPACLANYTNAIDQQSDSGRTLVGFGDGFWQSFTAGVEGRLEGVTIWYQGPACSFWVAILNGDGRDGDVLPSGQVFVELTGSPLVVSPRLLSLGAGPYLEAGQVVTLRVFGGDIDLCGQFHVATSDVYAGGHYENDSQGGNPGWDLRFRTRMMALVRCGSCEACTSTGDCVQTGFADVDPFNDCPTCETCGVSGLCWPVDAGLDPINDCGVCDVCNGSSACTPVANGEDPYDECEGTHPTCGGVCNGSGGCRYPIAGLRCGLFMVCDGAGHCVSS